MKSLNQFIKHLRCFTPILVLLAVLNVRAASLLQVHSFPGQDFFPNGLVQVTNGIFLGTMHQTGPISYGGIFELDTTNGAVTTLLNFGSTNGADPKSRLILGSDGNFYGVTETGGANNYGTVFQLTPGGVLTTLAQFPGGNSAFPVGELVQGFNGNFYGTTTGSVFQVTMGGALTTLATINPLNGGTLQAGLVQDASGVLYGTTEYGGTYSLGTVFRMPTNGTLATLISFSGTNGAYPTAKLALGNDGNLYGTTFAGGVLPNTTVPDGQGTIFRISTNGTSFTSLVTFGWTNGSQPQASLTLGTDGNFYGVTLSGGTNGFGTVFQMTPSGNLTTLYSFSGTDGSQPDAPLTLGSDGNLYGTTRSSTPSGNGTAFEITTSGAFTNLAYFYNPDGSTPHSGLVTGTNGDYYGTTEFGGQANLGTVYQMTPGGAVSTLVYFNSTNGACPVSDLTPGPSGLLYGSTYDGGASNLGTIFSLDLSGNLATLVSFNETNGANPQSKLVLWSDGNFYGTTCRGGTNDYGTIFRMTPGGTLTTLANLASNTSPADLFMGVDGNLYGVNYNNNTGSTGYGKVFVLTPGEVFSNLFTLSSSVGGVVAPFIQVANDSFYGVTPDTTVSGGGDGAIFNLNTTGMVTTVYGIQTYNGSSAPVMPTTPLLQGQDGNFYASTLQGGTNGYGTAYKTTPSLANNGLSFYSFNYTNGAFPDSDLVESPDGSLYGTTSTAGGLGGGNIYELYQVVPIPAGILSAAENGNGVTLVWTAITGRNYQVQFSSDLTSGLWNNLSGLLMATNTTMVTVDPSPSGSARFYRIQSQ